MVTIDGTIPPITPFGIKEMIEERFSGKLITEKTTQKIIQFKHEWVKSIIHNGQTANALMCYIDCLVLDRINQ